MTLHKMYEAPVFFSRFHGWSHSYEPFSHNPILSSVWEIVDDDESYLAHADKLTTSHRVGRGTR